MRWVTEEEEYEEADRRADEALRLEQEANARWLRESDDPEALRAFLRSVGEDFGPDDLPPGVWTP